MQICAKGCYTQHLQQKYYESGVDWDESTNSQSDKQNIIDLCALFADFRERFAPVVDCLANQKFLLFERFLVNADKHLLNATNGEFAQIWAAAELVSNAIGIHIKHIALLQIDNVVCEPRRFVDVNAARHLICLVFNNFAIANNN